LPEWLDSKLAALNRLEGYAGTGEKPDAGIIRLDHNENWHVSAEEIREVVAEALSQLDIRRYPEEGFGELLGLVGSRFGVPRESLVLTSGADQGIDLLCQAFLKGGETAYIVTPTFSFYALRASLAGSRVKELEMNGDLTLPLKKVDELGEGGLLFICSPNNPTGNQFARSEILHAVESFKGLVVLDEAYADFAPYDLIREAPKRRNLVVLRTFSKAFGMAGLRLGCMVTNPALARQFNTKIQYPYPISSFSLAVASRILGNPELTRRGVESTIAQRKRLTEELRKLGEVRVLESQANFVLASTPLKSEVLRKKLLEKQVAVKSIGDTLGLSGCVRITVGTKPMNDKLLKAMEGALGVA